MEESKELQGTYTLFRAVIYVTLLLEFFMYAFNPEDLDFLGGIITGLHRQLQHLSVYQFLYHRCTECFDSQPSGNPSE